MAVLRGYVLTALQVRCGFRVSLLPSTLTAFHRAEGSGLCSATHPHARPLLAQRRPRSGMTWTACAYPLSRIKKNYSAERWNGFEEGSYSRLIDFYHSTLGSRMTDKRRRRTPLSLPHSTVTPPAFDTALSRRRLYSWPEMMSGIYLKRVGFRVAGEFHLTECIY